MADSVGVQLTDMQDYLGVESDEDKDVIQNLINMAEADVQGNIDSTISMDTYRKYELFNQAVRTMVDFTYFNRGTLGNQQIAYPPSYLYMVNGIRYKIRGATNADSSTSAS